MLRSARSAPLWAAVLTLVAAFGLTTARADALTPGRSYEMVSPAEKNGGNITIDTGRTRAAADGSAVGLSSLSAFGDATGTGVATDYVSVRSTPSNPVPGNGWATHAITPFQDSAPLIGALARLEPHYVGDFTADLQRGVFFATTPLTDDPNVAAGFNLYRRDDLRAPGGGVYKLLTACPLCEATDTPLEEVPGNVSALFNARPVLAGMSPDGAHVAFHSRRRLTVDTPIATNRTQLFEWANGTVRLAGRVPGAPSIACDDVNGPACVTTDVTVAAQGVETPAPHVVSDGSDGHSRIFFTNPTDGGGAPSPNATEGWVYARVDGTSTVLVNASERTRGPASAYAPASYLDASVDGTRIFIQTRQALTDDAPANTLTKIYRYDASKPASAPNNLTYVMPDTEPEDGPAGEGVGVIGASDDGTSLYMIVLGQLVDGEELLGTEAGIYLWREGQPLTFVGPSAFVGAAQTELLSIGNVVPRQARVTPDGRFLLFSSFSGQGYGGYDHGDSCDSPFTIDRRCRGLYVYSADGDEVICASCNPSGAPAASMAAVMARTRHGGSQTTLHLSHPLTDDGSRVFFHTGDALVPEDTNGRIDVYEFDVPEKSVHLLSSGRSTADSYFMDATPDGRDAFFITQERLVGWDRDDAQDLYDARIGGGFKEPEVRTPCTGDACQGRQAGPPAAAPVYSSDTGARDLEERLQPRKRAKRCRRGFIKKRVRGKTRCVRRRARGRRNRRARARGKRGTS